ncbi:MAG: hypothetical protein RLZZ436_2580 [Planctomycetota bacterium]
MPNSTEHSTPSCHIDVAAKVRNMSQQNPFSVPSTFGETATEQVTQQAYGGIGRLAYFGYSFLNSFVSNILTFAIAAAAPSAAAGSVIAVGLLSVIAAIVIVVQRLKNLGYSGWWTLGLLVPILNLVLAIELVAAPEGYAKHKTLDTPGKVVVGLTVGLFLLAVAVVILAAI